MSLTTPDPAARALAASLDDPCPVINVARRAETQARDLNLTLKHLRQAMRRCDKCPLDCPTITDLHAGIHAALTEIAEEWQL